MEVTIEVRLPGLTTMLLRRLGLGAGASPSEIQHAYRSAAKRTHPDLGGDPAEFRDITSAYAKLRALGRVP